ncbi:MAG: c-type cytochrome [Pseudomonadales bacterium]|nr:c-type cytochrome [Pseudomonadales bacterium]
MQTLLRLALYGVVPLALLACAAEYNPLDDYEQLTPVTLLEAPPATANNHPPEAVARGQYLVALLGCGSCHTDGALVGEPSSARLLAGSGVGIAYSNPLAQANPGVVYPPNLTPDANTGIGNWTLEQIMVMVKSGTDNHGSQTLPVMPWPAYANITDDDARAIAMYLQSLTPVNHRVPANVRPGQRATAPFVHFGVYRSRP